LASQYLGKENGYIFNLETCGKHVFESVVLNVTTECTRNCEHCSQQYWMRDFPNYHMGLHEVNLFITNSIRQGVSWDNVIICGGEPLLWNNLEAGSRMIRESGICNHLTILSNGDPIDKLVAIQYLFDTIEISNYKNGNAERIKNEWGDKVKLVQGRHLPYPDKLLNVSPPTKCMCDRPCYHNGHMFPCGNTYTVNKRFNKPFDKFMKNINDDWADWLLRVKKYHQPGCLGCLSNQKVWKLMKGKL
jgi:hypothetical protein